MAQLREVRLFAECHDDVLAEWPALPERRVVHEVVRRMIDRTVVDLLGTTRAALERVAPGSPPRRRRPRRPRRRRS